MASQPVEKISAFYATIRFFSVFKRTRHFSLYGARLTQSKLSHSVSVISILTFKDEAQTALFKDPVRTAQ